MSTVRKMRWEAEQNFEFILRDDGLAVGPEHDDPAAVIRLDQIEIFLPGDERDDIEPARARLLAQIDALRARVVDWKW